MNVHIKQNLKTHGGKTQPAFIQILEFILILEHYSKQNLFQSVLQKKLLTACQRSEHQ